MAQRKIKCPATGCRMLVGLSGFMPHVTRTHGFTVSQARRAMEAGRRGEEPEPIAEVARPVVTSGAPPKMPVAVPVMARQTKRDMLPVEVIVIPDVTLRDVINGMRVRSQNIRSVLVDLEAKKLEADNLDANIRILEDAALKLHPPADTSQD